VTEPFLRWAGGKRWLARKLAPILRARLAGRYFEPFLGSGAMFFSLHPKVALLSDVNKELIETYQVVAAESERLIRDLQKLAVDAETYYRIRSWEAKTRYERALRFIYLNRTCYGGLYRTNRQGKFNVPFGGGSRTPEVLWRKGLLKKASELLQQSGIRLLNDDFEPVIDKAGVGDVVYCDPVYTTTAFSQFDRYNPKVFQWREQERLRDVAYRACARGALVLISNVFAPDIRHLYLNGLFMLFSCKKSIGNAAKKHKSGNEYLIILDPERRIQEWQRLGTVDWGDTPCSHQENIRFKEQLTTAGKAS